MLRFIIYSFIYVLIFLRNDTTHTFYFQNPFYELDMPIKVDLFNRGIDLLIEKYHSSGSRR